MMLFRLILIINTQRVVLKLVGKQLTGSRMMTVQRNRIKLAETPDARRATACGGGLRPAARRPHLCFMAEMTLT
jgi:hypothetical protein